MKSRAGWEAACRAIEAHDPHTRGIVVLGLGADEAELAASFAEAARHPLVRGFAVGRTIHAAPGRAWLAGEIGDAECVARMAEGYARLCAIWDEARSQRENAA
jgi:5-dehydro-2-deoxygluconokinase